jgi:hypothetical protein
MQMLIGQLDTPHANVDWSTRYVAFLMMIGQPDTVLDADWSNT